MKLNYRNRHSLLSLQVIDRVIFSSETSALTMSWAVRTARCDCWHAREGFPGSVSPAGVPWDGLKSMAVAVNEHE